MATQSSVSPSEESQKPVLLLILTAFLIFAAETGLMLILAIIHDRLSIWQQAVIDASLLLLLMLPPIYLLYLVTLRPMRLHIKGLLHFGTQLEQQIAERRDAEAELRQSEERLHQLSAQLLTLQEKERERVSRELHEDLGQSLVVLKLRLRLAESKIGEGQHAARHELWRAAEQIDDMVRHIGRLSGDLSPAILENLGFTAAARRLVSSCAGNSCPDTTIRVDDGADDFLKGAVGLHTYRVLQEALENVQRHAVASHVSVEVKMTAEEVSLIVEDDGRGFDSCREEERGVGLATMYERARMLNGSLALRSQAGGGTRVTLKIPRAVRLVQHAS